MSRKVLFCLPLVGITIKIKLQVAHKFHERNPWLVLIILFYLKSNIAYVNNIDIDKMQLNITIQIKRI